MKILHVGSPLTDFMGNFGLTFRCSKGLQDLGHEVTIVTTDADCFFFDKEKSHKYVKTRQKLLKAKDEPVLFNGVPTYAIHSITPRFGILTPSATKFAKKIIGNYDIVHVCLWYSHISMVFAKVAYEYKIPYFISPWGSLLTGARNLKKRQKWVADLLYTRKILPNASGYHSVGNSETNEFIKMGINPKKIYEIGNPVDLENFKITEHTNILERSRINKNEQRYLLYLSRINPKKGLELLLEAFSSIIKDYKDLKLIIAGSGEENYVNKIRQLVKELKLENMVIFTGLVSENEKLELLESATLFVLTSHSDVHPIAVQDALAMGIPVVITKECDYPEVDEYKAGISVDPTISSIKEGILKMLESKDQFAVFSQNAKKIINDKFVLKDLAKKYEQMYLDSLRNKK